MMGTGYGSRNITCIPPSTSESDRGPHVLCTVVVWHSLCTPLFGGLLNSTQTRTLLHISPYPVSTWLATVTRVLKEARS